MVCLSFIIFSINYWYLSHSCLVFCVGSILTGYGLYILKNKGGIKLHRNVVIFCISIIIASFISSGIYYIFKYDYNYEISINIQPDGFGEYRLIIPLPLNYDGDVKFSARYKTDQSHIVETIYGKGLEITGNESFFLRFKGRDREHIIGMYSLKDTNYTISENSRYFMVYLEKNGKEDSMNIEIKYCSDGPTSGSEGGVKVLLKEEGWSLFERPVSGWVV